MTFALSPGKAGDAPAGRALLHGLAVTAHALPSDQGGFRRIFSRFDKLDVMFMAFIHFALIVEALR